MIHRLLTLHWFYSSLRMDVLLVCSTIMLLLPVARALGSGDDGWSVNVQPEVRAIDGYPVVLPCTFTHPQNSQHASLQVVWRLSHGQGARVLYRCTSRLGSPSCDPGPHQDERYRLEGNPREHDLSLWINSATLQDSGRYYCGVEVDGRERVSFEDQTGTRLRVEAPPRILDVSVEGREPSGYRAVCRVQGSPPPDVQWLGPENQIKAVEPQGRGSVGGPLDRGTAPRFHTVSQLRDVEPGRQYTCSASNPLGREQSTLYVAAPQAGLAEAEAPPPLLLLLSVSLGAKIILLVGMVLWLAQGGVSSWWKQPVVK